MRRTLPPGEYGPSAETRAAWRRQDERANERSRLDRIAAQPGGRALLMRTLLLDREQQARVRADTTTGPSERRRLTAGADELARMAAQAVYEAEEYDAMKTAKQITEAAQKRFRDIGQRWAQVREADDKDHAPSDVQWRTEQRAKLRKEWLQVESQAYAEITEWRNAERQRHTTAYHADPLGDAAQETRRQREELETAALAAQYIGKRVEARGRLLPQVREALAVGNVARAQVVLNALKRVGIEDGRLDHAVNTTLDQMVPHRKAALEGLGRVEQEIDRLRLAIVTERQASGVGTSQEQIRASSYRKMLEFRQQQGLIVNAGNGSGDGAAAGEPEASGAGASGGAAGE